MLNLFRQLKNWYLQSRSLLETAFSRDRSGNAASARSQTELPPAIAQRTRETLQALPIPPALVKTVRDTLDDAIEQWLEQPVAGENSLTLLSSPIEPIARILSASLEDWQPKNDIPIRMLNWTERPTDPTTLQTKLVAQLGRGLPCGTNRPQEIVVIPNLSWCFLRCAEGLDGIEYLRKTIATERSRFWVVGCGKLAWNYLDLVCKIAAYYQQNFSLPQLNGEQLQAWLTPVIDEIGIDFSPVQEQTEDRDRESAQQEYFKRLAAVSEGSSCVAAQLLMRSLVFQPSETEADEEEGKETNEQTGKVLAKNPNLPDLPDLSPDAHYLIYSLLLHSDLTLPHLVDSLGDDEATVQHLVQILRSAGTIEKQGELFQVNPLHYPKLKNELDGNNFLIAEDEE